MCLLFVVKFDSTTLFSYVYRDKNTIISVVGLRASCVFIKFHRFTSFGCNITKVKSQYKQKSFTHSLAMLPHRSSAILSGWII